MPGMSSRELAERFTLQRPGVLRPGIAYLQKPFTPDALARKIREVIDAVPSLPVCL